MPIQTQIHRSPDALVSALYSTLDACFPAGHVLLKVTVLICVHEQGLDTV